MDLVENEVKLILNQTFVGKQYDLQYGTSFDGIHYALLTTTVVWYKVWIISNVSKNESAGFEHVMGRPLRNENILVREVEKMTNSRWANYIKECKEELTKGINTCLFNPEDISQPPTHAYFTKRQLPLEATQNPKAHLNPGDLVFCNFVLGAYHAGIYIGNGEVVHVHGEGESSFDRKKSSCVRIGRLCGDFVKPGEQIWVLNCVYRFRTPAKIVQIAKEYANNGFRNGQYNLITKNCQHFASLCAFGFEYSSDATMDKSSQFIGGMLIPSPLSWQGSTR